MAFSRTVRGRCYVARHQPSCDGGDTHSHRMPVGLPPSGERSTGPSSQILLEIREQQQTGYPLRYIECQSRLRAGKQTTRSTVSLRFVVTTRHVSFLNCKGGVPDPLLGSSVVLWPGKGGCIFGDCRRSHFEAPSVRNNPREQVTFTR